MKHMPRKIFSRVLLFALPMFSASAEIRARLSPSPRRVLESAGARFAYSTPATVNGASATLGAYTFPAMPSSASAEAARLLNLPAASSGDGLITSNGRTHLIVLPAANPRQSLLFLTQFDTAPDPGRAIAFPENLPHPGNATPTFSATLEATQTSFAIATSHASSAELHDDMRRLLAAQQWQPALPATDGQSMMMYSRGNAVFLVHTTPQAGGRTRLALFQHLTSNPNQT